MVRKMEEKKRRRKKTKNEHPPRGPWLTVRQAAEYLSLSEQAIRDLEYSGSLPGHRFGASLRFSQTELDEQLSKHRRATASELANGTLEIPPGPLGPLMSQGETAEYLALPSIKALEHRLRRGQIPAYRLGGQWRFRAVELDAALIGEPRCLTRDPGRGTFDHDARLPRKEVE